MKSENKNQVDSENMDDLDIENSGKDDLKNSSEEDKVVISKTKILLMKKILGNIKTNNEKLLDLLAVFINPEDESRLAVSQMAAVFLCGKVTIRSGSIAEPSRTNRSVERSVARLVTMASINGQTFWR